MPVDLVAIHLAELERLEQKEVAHVLGHAAFDLEPHRLAEAAALQFRFDRAQQIVGFVLLQISRSASRVTRKR